MIFFSSILNISTRWENIPVIVRSTECIYMYLGLLIFCVVLCCCNHLKVNHHNPQKVWKKLPMWYLFFITFLLKIYMYIKFWYSDIIKITRDSNLQWLQFETLHRLLPMNYYLHKLKLIESPNCSFCRKHPETIDHLFVEC